MSKSTLLIFFCATEIKAYIEVAEGVRGNRVEHLFGPRQFLFLGPEIWCRTKLLMVSKLYQSVDLAKSAISIT